MHECYPAWYFWHGNMDLFLCTIQMLLRKRKCFCFFLQLTFINIFYHIFFYVPESFLPMRLLCILYALLQTIHFSSEEKVQYHAASPHRIQLIVAFAMLPVTIFVFLVLFVKIIRQLPFPSSANCTCEVIILMVPNWIQLADHDSSAAVRCRLPYRQSAPFRHHRLPKGKGPFRSCTLEPMHRASFPRRALFSRAFLADLCIANTQRNLVSSTLCLTYHAQGPRSASFSPALLSSTQKQKKSNQNMDEKK